MTRSLAAGRRVTLAHVGLFADGVAVKQVGKETFRLARELVDEMIAGRHRRDLRGDQGRVRGHALDPRARRRAGGRRRQGVGRAPPRARPHVRRHRLRRQHELRPAALRRRARRAGRAARGDLRRDDPRAARQLPRVLRAARQRATSPSSTIATPIRSTAHLFVGRRGRRSRGPPPQLLASFRRHRIEALRPVRQRDGEAARAPSGGRPRARPRRTRSCIASSFPSGPGR